MTLVVEFKEFGSPVQVLFGLAGSAGIQGWQCSADDLAALGAIDQLPWGERPLGTAPAVQTAGQMLRAKLGAEAALESAFADVFAAGAQAARPLYFRTGKDPSVESVPFEALWDNHIAGFPCLDPIWPIARIPSDVTPPAGPFTMERAVRVVAVVAAEGIDPIGQIDALLAGCAAPAGLTVELTVLTTTTAAIARVQAAGIPGWQAELVPATSEDLMIRLKALQPHLLHVFCHGTAASDAADAPRLLVAQRDDLAVLELSAGSFQALANPAYVAPWLVALNCCESAAPGPGQDTVSLASGLVRNGLPAVVGMRKAIDSRMADDFCKNLYVAALTRLALIAPLGRTVASLDWAEVLHEPRRRLCADFGTPGEVANRQKEWTMPVLYVSSPDLRLRGRPTAALDDRTIKAELMTLGTADGVEAGSGVPPAIADQLRSVALDTLYPKV